MNPSRRPLPDAGFSLVEALVSLLLLAMMLAMLPTMVQLGRRAWQGSEALELRDQNAAARNIVSELIASSAHTLVRDAAGVHRYAFDGEDNAISFVTEDRRGPFGGGLYSVAVRRSEDGRRLIVKHQRFAGAMARGSDAEPSQESMLVDRVADLRIRYLEAGEVREGDRWRSSWKNRDTLPALVELEITLTTGERMIDVVEMRMR